jgi:hypothetical protein
MTISKRARLALVAAASAAVVVGAVGAAAGAGPTVGDKAEVGTNVYAGMSDDEILAYDQKAAQSRAQQLKGYIVAHRSELEASLATLPVREALALVRAYGPTLDATVATADTAFGGDVISVSLGDDGSVIGHVKVTSVGKRGDTSISVGQITDIQQAVHLDLESGVPVLIAPPGLVPIVTGQVGVYFLTQSDAGLTASFAGAVLPVRDGIVHAPSVPIQKQVDGRAVADLMANVKSLANE